MRPIPLVLMALPLIASCATTPLQQCQLPYRNQLHNVRDDIRETGDAIRRGYRLTPAATDIGIHYCVDGTGFARLCTADDGQPMYDKRPVNRGAENAKLAVLHADEARLNAALAACAARYPE